MISELLFRNVAMSVKTDAKERLNELLSRVPGNNVDGAAFAESVPVRQLCFSQCMSRSNSDGIDSALLAKGPADWTTKPPRKHFA